jgi:hypothetical protein
MMKDQVYRALGTGETTGMMKNQVYRALGTGSGVLRLGNRIRCTAPWEPERPLAVGRWLPSYWNEYCEENISAHTWQKLNTFFPEWILSRNSPNRSRYACLSFLAGMDHLQRHVTEHQTVNCQNNPQARLSAVADEQ